MTTKPDIGHFDELENGTARITRIQPESRKVHLEYSGSGKKAELTELSFMRFIKHFPCDELKEGLEIEIQLPKEPKVHKNTHTKRFPYFLDQIRDGKILSFCGAKIL